MKFTVIQCAHIIYILFGPWQGPQWVPCDKKNEKKPGHIVIQVGCRGTTTSTTTIIGGKVSKKTIKDEACFDYRSWTSNDLTGHRLFKKNCDIIMTSSRSISQITREPYKIQIIATTHIKPC